MINQLKWHVSSNPSGFKLSPSFRGTSQMPPRCPSQRNLPDAPVFQQALAMERFERVQGSLGRLDHSHSPLVLYVCFLPWLQRALFVCAFVSYLETEILRVLQLGTERIVNHNTQVNTKQTLRPGGMFQRRTNT